MKGYIFSICLMMVGTIALAYNNLEYSGYPRNTSCTGECYEEYVSIYGTPSEIERAKQELASADEFSSSTPSESSSKVSSESIVISPDPVDAKAILPVPDVILTAVAPVALPRFIVSANAPVPILMVLSP